MCIIKTSFQDVLVQAEPRVAYFHPSALNGASLLARGIL